MAQNNFTQIIVARLFFSQFNYRLSRLFRQEANKINPSHVSIEGFYDIYRGTKMDILRKLGGHFRKRAFDFDASFVQYISGLQSHEVSFLDGQTFKWNKEIRVIQLAEMDSWFTPYPENINVLIAILTVVRNYIAYLEQLINKEINEE